MASMKFEKLTGTTVSMTRIRMTFTPDGESRMPVLVDFWRQDADQNRDIEQVWMDLAMAYQQPVTSDVIIQPLN